MSYTVRDAKSSDYGYVCEAFGKVNDLHLHMQPKQYRQVDKIATKLQFLAVTVGGQLIKPIRDKYSIKIVEHESERVGAVVVESIGRGALSWSAFSKVANIENITASFEHRSKGAIDALQESAEDWARSTGHDVMTGKISSENSKSLKKAEQSGFFVASMNVVKFL